MDNQVKQKALQILEETLNQLEELPRKKNDPLTRTIRGIEYHINQIIKEATK